jgi:hypothetical protein
MRGTPQKKTAEPFQKTFHKRVDTLAGGRYSDKAAEGNA